MAHQDVSMKHNGPGMSKPCNASEYNKEHTDKHAISDIASESVHGGDHYL